MWIPLDGTSVETKTVAKNITSFLIKDLDSRKAYHVTLALVVNNQPGLKSQKLQITPKLGWLFLFLAVAFSRVFISFFTFH